MLIGFVIVIDFVIFYQLRACEGFLTLLGNDRKRLIPVEAISNTPKYILHASVCPIPFVGL